VWLTVVEKFLNKEIWVKRFQAIQDSDRIFLLLFHPAQDHIRPNPPLTHPLCPFSHLYSPFLDTKLVEHSGEKPDNEFPEILFFSFVGQNLTEEIGSIFLA
jgi:hypothetical protein